MGGARYSLTNKGAALLRPQGDLSRAVLLDVSACGAVLTRNRGQAMTEGYLPMFSVDTLDEATQLIVFHCHLDRETSTVYRINNWKAHDLDEIARGANLFRAHYTRMLERRGTPAAQFDGDKSKVKKPRRKVVR
jgi:hypothetical protein